KKDKGFGFTIMRGRKSLALGVNEDDVSDTAREPSFYNVNEARPSFTSVSPNCQTKCTFDSLNSFCYTHTKISMENLKSCYLEHISIEKSNLIDFYLVNTVVINDPLDLNYLSNLTQNIRVNGVLTHLPLITNLKNLKILKINFHWINQLDKPHFYPSSIEIFDLVDGKIMIIQRDFFAHFENLKEINLQKNRIRDICLLDYGVIRNVILTGNNKEKYAHHTIKKNFSFENCKNYISTSTVAPTPIVITKKTTILSTKKTNMIKTNTIETTSKSTSKQTTFVSTSVQSSRLLKSTDAVSEKDLSSTKKTEENKQEEKPSLNKDLTFRNRILDYIIENPGVVVSIFTFIFLFLLFLFAYFAYSIEKLK
ncbi:unnamed protein product, partial [Brachionus calyciflorus]